LGYDPCVYCAQRKVDPDEAFQGMLAAGAIPLEPYPGLNKTPWRSRCASCEREISPTWNHVQKGRGVCAYCSKKKIDPEEAEKVMIRAGARPLVPYTSVETLWESECLRCGRRVNPKFHSVSAGHDPCRWCAPAGFDRSKPSLLYILFHENYQAWKFGITNLGTVNDRIGQFSSMGWEAVHLVEFTKGSDAEDAERRIKDWAKAKGHLPAVDRTDMPTGGWTETIRLADVRHHQAIVEASQIAT